MKIYDITLSLKEGMPVYPGDIPFERSVIKSFAQGNSGELSVLKLGSHTGTHVDAPAHMIDGGERLDQVPLDSLIGPARVFDLRHVQKLITADDLAEENWSGALRALFLTRNSERLAKAAAFETDYVALDGDAAQFLVEGKLKLIGVDGLSVDSFANSTHAAHLPLLGAGIVIIEGLNLSGVPAGDYTLFCGPLKVYASEGAPARVFLIGQ